MNDVPDTTELTSALRVMDANANRAGEGLRVVEDYLRFSLQDGFLSRTCKQLRHDLAETLAEFGSQRPLRCRSTATDVGTEIQTETEYQRAGGHDIATANLRRSAEALRCLEEFGKLRSEELAKRFESLRYRVYTLEKAVAHLHRARDQLASSLLYVLADLRYGSGEVFTQKIQALIECGVDVIQLRDKKHSDRTLILAAREVGRCTRGSDTLLIVNDRPDIARLANADGVHVGQDELSLADARAIVGPDALVGVSTHSIEQARTAVLDGADYIGVGPVFASATKSFDRYVGLDLVREVNAEIGLPSFAIGGVTNERLIELREAGALRIAVSSAVWGADDVVRACQELRASLVG